MPPASGGLRLVVWPAIIAGIVTLSGIVLKDIVAPNVTPQQVRTQIEQSKPDVIAASTEAAKRQIAASRPTWQVFPEIQTKRNHEQDLGEWSVCTLTTVGQVHHNQACTCEIFPVDEKAAKPRWKIKVALDQKVDGFCRCRPACFNFQAS